ncbi:MAG: PIN domain-containing protein [Deltaproteobacteria bacterium]|nr:PIN domain-containing protein [Deltaproteobacteria bacterium]
MIFLDTSAIYALSDKADPHHITALKKFDDALRAGETFLIHNYIIVESAALLQARLGYPTAARFLREVKSFDLEWIDQELHEDAEKELERIGKRGVSLVDCASFVVMKRRGVKEVLAFDADFQEQGFTLY